MINVYELKLRILSLSLIISISLSSCAQDDTTKATPLGEIEFTTSPIELGDIDAQFAADIAYDDNEKNTFDFFYQPVPVQQV